MLRQGASKLLRQQLLCRATSSAPLPTLMRGVQLLVCDMAGTTVEEAGLVYTTLQDCMNDEGLGVSAEDMETWHGAQKSEVVAHFTARAQYSDAAAAALEEKVNAAFEARLEANYLSPDSPLALIDPALPDYFDALRTAGVKVGLNTGYPRQLQGAILRKLRMRDMVDAVCSAQDVRAGRPSPYMVHQLMHEVGVEDVRAVAKAGDTQRDISEGLNAGCGQAIGVLSGADSREALEAAGAHVVVGNITQLPLEGMRLDLAAAASATLRRQLASLEASVHDGHERIAQLETQLAVLGGGNSSSAGTGAKHYACSTRAAGFGFGQAKAIREAQRLAREAGARARRCAATGM